MLCFPRQSKEFSVSDRKTCVLVKGKIQYRDCVGGVANSPEGCAPIQRDLYKQSPAPGQEETQATTCTGGHRAGNQVGMKTPGRILGDARLRPRQQCAPAAVVSQAALGKALPAGQGS